MGAVMSRATPVRSVPDTSRLPLWNLALVGTAMYLVVEYTRLAASYPALEPLQLGKVAVAIGLIGVLIIPSVERTAKFQSLGVSLFLILFYTLLVLNASGSTYEADAWNVVALVTNWMIIYLLVTRALNNSRRLKLIALVFIVLNLKLAQHTVRNFMYIRSTGLDDKLLSARGVGAGSTGFFANPDDFGVAMTVVWGLTAALLVGEQNKKVRWLLIACTPVFVLAVLMCGSRGAFIGSAVAALFLVWRSPKRIAGFAALGLFAVVTLIFLPQAHRERIIAGLTNPHKDKTAAIRLHLWESGIDMFRTHPFFGVGPGNYNKTYQRFYLSDEIAFQKVAAPHNIYIQAFSELGLIGAFPLGVLFIMVFRVNARTRKVLRAAGFDRTCFEYRMASALDVAFLGYCANGFFITVLYYPHFWLILPFTVATYNSALGLIKRTESSEQHSPEFGPRWQEPAAVNS